MIVEVEKHLTKKGNNILKFTFKDFDIYFQEDILSLQIDKTYIK